MKKWVQNYRSALSEVESAINAKSVLDKDLELRRANLLMILGCMSDAFENLDRLRASYPNDVHVFFQYARIAVPFGRFSAAELSEWVWRRRTDPTVLTLYAMMLNESGAHQQAIEQVLLALRIPHRMPNILNEMVFAALYSDSIDVNEFRKNLLVGVGVQFKPVSAFKSRIPDKRRYSVGFVCAATREHPMFYFLAPLLSGLDRREFTVSMFSTDLVRDRRTAHLESMVDLWYDVGSLDDVAFLNLLREERLDVLIDLDNHTLNNRLWVLAQRVAPIQMSAYGLHITTGIPAVDYRVTDWMVDPPGFENQYAENLLRTEGLHFGYYCDDRELPAENIDLEVGKVVIGSFNHMLKISDSMISFWKEMLNRFPEIELRIYSANNGIVVRRITEAFEQSGIDEDRYSFHDRLLPEQLAQEILRCDFALDSWPYAGGVTSAMLLSYGVPVLTLSTDRAAGRLGAALNKELSLESFTGRDVHHLLDIMEEKIAMREEIFKQRPILRDQFRTTVGDCKRVGAVWSAALLKVIEESKKTARPSR